MWSGSYWAKTYWYGGYWHPAGDAVAQVVRKIRGLWSIHGTMFKHRNIVKGEVK